MRRKWICILFLLMAAGGLMAADVAVQSIEVAPTKITLSEPEHGRGVLVTGITAGGERLDLTRSAKLSSGSGVVRVGDDGYLYAVKAGSANVTVEAGGHSAELAVTVDLSEGQHRTFVRDVMPILNKQSCTSGPCHGSAKGKNGFKLSLRGYDPEYDYRALLFEISGRRFNRAAPEQSLMLAKPTQMVPHEGGMRIEPGSRYYQAILDWISTGAPFGDSQKDQVASLEVMPKEIFMGKSGMSQQVLVTATFPDGTVRDVTREASIESNSTSTAKVGDGGMVNGERVGEAALLVRYEGKFVTLPITILNPEPGFEFQKLSQLNYIDEHIDEKLARLKIQPSPLADEATFLRRIYLDLTGIPPTTEAARAYLEDSSASHIKREKLIDELVGSKGYVDHWSLKWGDLLQSNRDFLGEKGTWAFRQWIRDAVASNKPYDEMTRELLTSAGSTYDNPAANFYRVNDDPKRAMENTTQLFLGVRMVCAQCHDHPFEKWTQNQYFQLSAFFSAVGVKPGFDSEEQIVYLKRDDNEMEHPKSGKVVDPQYLIANAGAPLIADYSDRRQPLSMWLTSEKNPFFARAIVNRVWSYFFGRGIIEPVDDIRASNPPVNEALLETLAADFIRNGYDLQKLIRTIAKSRTYQAAFQTNKWNENDETNFSHFVPRRLPAESILDAMMVATGSRPEFEDVPVGFTAQELPDPHVGEGGFLDMFGRPERESACECERRGEMSLPQAMNLVNGPTLAEAIADPEGRVAEAIVAGRSDRDLIEELYLAALTRMPTANELDQALTYLRGGQGRAARAQDLLWALVNSNAFLFNR